MKFNKLIKGLFCSTLLFTFKVTAKEKNGECKNIEKFTFGCRENAQGEIIEIDLKFGLSENELQKIFSYKTIKDLNLIMYKNINQSIIDRVCSLPNLEKLSIATDVIYDKNANYECLGKLDKLLNAARDLNTSIPIDSGAAKQVQDEQYDNENSLYQVGDEIEFDYPDNLSADALEYIYEVYLKKGIEKGKKYIVSKDERKKQATLFKIDPKDFMSVREYIESEGSMSINTHPNTYKLESEFIKYNKYKGDESLNNFEIICLLGKGSTSNVYLANYEGQKVVLKIFDKVYLYQNDLIDKILLEKNILSSFQDEKFLCHMKFYFTTVTKLVFVLPFYPGGDLFNFLQNHGPFDESTTAFYITQIAYIISK